MRHLCIVAVAMISSASTVWAHDYKIGDLMVAHPMTFATARTAQTAGGFFEVTNTGETADRLVSVSADFPRVEVHATQMDGDIARMVHQEDGVEIAAGATLTLQPGGYHVMFMGLGGDPFEVGEEVPATLHFEHAGALEIVFTVEDRAAHSLMDHDMMDHGDN